MYDTLPEVKGRIFVSAYEPTNVAPRQVNVSQTGKVSTKWTGVQRWDFTVRVEAFGHENIRTVQNFFNTHIDTPFLISLPLFQGTATSNGVVGASTPVRSSAVQVTGFKGSIQQGDFFTFGNHTKLYQARNTIKGSGNLQLFPPLRSLVTASEPLILQNVAICVRLTGDVKHAIDDVDWNATFEFEVKEAF